MAKNLDTDDALTAVTDARRRLADKIYTPWWYHPILGVLVALLVLQIGGLLGRSGMLATPAPVLGMIALGCLYRRLSGVDLTGPNSPDGGQRGRSLLAIYLCALLVCFASSFLLSYQLRWHWTAWALAALVTVWTVAVGRRYDRLLRTQLRDNAP